MCLQTSHPTTLVIGHRIYLLCELGILTDVTVHQKLNSSRFRLKVETVVLFQVIMSILNNGGHLLMPKLVRSQKVGAGKSYWLKLTFSVHQQEIQPHYAMINNVIFRKQLRKIYSTWKIIHFWDRMTQTWFKYSYPGYSLHKRQLEM